jgi:transposase
LHNFNADDSDSLQPKYGGGRPPKFTLPQRQEIKKTALARPTDHGLPFSTWSLPMLADYPVTKGWSTTSATKAYACCSARRASAFKP